MPEEVWRAVGGFGAAIVVAAVGRRRRSLSGSGAVAAVPVGGLVVAGGGWWWGVVLVVFFATSSALSGVGRRARGQAAPMTARGGERDVVQVLANGGVATMLAGVAAFAEGDLRVGVFAAFAGAIAAVTADTWATELGAFSRTPPRSITSGRTVAPGVSGGVTPVGTLASAGGAGVIAGVAAVGSVFGWAPAADGARLLVAVTVAGVAGSLTDSVLGATVQAAYRCPVCNLPTERRVHRCGTPTVRTRGHDAVTNDVVNAIASFVGAAVGTLAVVGG